MRNFIILLICVVIGLCTSCDGMLDNIQTYLDEGETIYVGKVDSLEAFPGKNRVQLKGYYLYGVTQKKCVIEWLSMEEEEMKLELDVVRENPEDPFEVQIDNLDEGQYEFSITTYDAQGNHSIESVIESYVYGDLYESNLTNRRINSKNITGTTMEINWRPVNDALEVELYYNDREGNEVKRIIPVSETRTIIDDCAYEGTIRWRTVYLPEKNAIDKFYSEETIEEYSFYVERELDKSKFKEVKLSGDIGMNAWGTNMSNIWDDKYGYEEENGFSQADDSQSTLLPQSFTFDLGVLTELTSFRLWQRSKNAFETFIYNSANCKKWEIWGCNQMPSTEYDEKEWTKLMDCEITKPSGLPIGQINDDDIAAADEGHEFIFPEGLPPVRYIRFTVKETWNGTNNTFFVQEVSFYGIEQYN